MQTRGVTAVMPMELSERTAIRSDSLPKGSQSEFSTSSLLPTGFYFILFLFFGFLSPLCFLGTHFPTLDC